MVFLWQPRFAQASILDTLDYKIASKKSYEISKSREIAAHKFEFDTASTDQSKYNALRGLYQGYRSFRIDSALIMANKRLEIAKRLDDKSKIISASLNLAEGYVKSGAPDEALAILLSIDPGSLEDYHLKYYDSILRNAYLLKVNSAMLPSDRMAAKDMVNRLRDKTLSLISHDSKGYYTLSAEKLVDAGLYEEAVALMEEADRIFDFSNDAALQYSMGEIYLAAGQHDKAIEKLANSAILDISSGTKEYQSLILLASLLFEEGDVERAFNYINCAFEDAEFSNAKLRTPEIMKILPVINQTFRSYEKRNARLTHIFLWAAGSLVVLLLISGFFLWRTLRANRKMLSTIEDINTRLEARNSRLEEADALKLQHINNLMLSNARYISRLKDFRKSVYRLMKTGQYDKALDTLKSDRMDAKDIVAFHEMFDMSFLSMFPDFVVNVNKLLKTPVSLKESNRLTPELRVMALMRLGLSSTEEISGMLHYSAQTVYNLRTSIRSMTDLSREEFEERIRNIS